MCIHAICRYIRIIILHNEESHQVKNINFVTFKFILANVNLSKKNINYILPCKGFN